MHTKAIMMQLRLGILGLLASAMVAIPAAQTALAQSSGTTANTTSETLRTQTINDLKELELKAQKAIEQVEPAIVAIGNRFGRKNPERLASEGNRYASGVIISADGLILSQYHVSHQGIVDEDVGLCIYGEPGDKVDVILADGRRMHGVLLGGDQQADISLLKLAEPGSYPFASLASSQRPELGQWTIKLGHPTGYLPRRGVSARLGRVLYANDLNLVTTCRTHAGDSGGPLINFDSAIVGLVQNSLMPSNVQQLAGRLDATPMAYMSAGRIHDKLEAIKTSIVRDTLFQDYSERQRQYAAVTTTLPEATAGLGLGVGPAYTSTTIRSNPSVVQILGQDNRPIAYGTIISSDGLVVTKASYLQSNAVYRLHNGSTAKATIIGSDKANDVALLKLDQPGMPPLRFAESQVDRGTILLAPSRDLGWDIGIVSAPTHDRAIALELSKDGSQVNNTTYPQAFEHDVPLESAMFGGPLINLQGELVGITIASAGHHGSLALPGAAIKRIILSLHPSNLP